MQANDLKVGMRFKSPSDSRPSIVKEVGRFDRTAGTNQLRSCGPGYVHIRTMGDQTFCFDTQAVVN